MSVIRVKHETHYVVLNKEILENPNISLKAKGLWAFCMAKPDHWEFHITQLESSLKEGKKCLYNALQELTKFGYCMKVQGKDEYGKFTAVDYEIFETSQIQKILPQSPFGHAADRHAEKEPLVSNECEQVKKEIVCPTPPVGEPVPQKIIKKRTDGKEEIADQSILFKKALSLKKDWGTHEILEAWHILDKCEGAVNDWFRFIEGTIKKLRNKKNFEKIEAQRTTPKPLEKHECRTNTQKTSTPLTKDSIQQLFLTAGLPIPK